MGLRIYILRRFFFCLLFCANVPEFHFNLLSANNMGFPCGLKMHRCCDVFVYFPTCSILGPEYNFNLLLSGAVSLCGPTHLNFCFQIEEAEHGLHVNKGLAHFSVHRTQKVERQRQLKKKAVDHHQISNSHCA